MFSDRLMSLVGGLVIVLEGVVFLLLNEQFPFSRLWFIPRLRSRANTLTRSLAEKTGIPAPYLEAGSPIALGFGFITIEEWALTLAAWVLLAVVLIVRATKWRDEQGKKKNIGWRVLAVIGATLSCLFLSVVTIVRKPDSQPWSNIQKLWPQTRASVLPSPATSSSYSTTSSVPDNNDQFALLHLSRKRKAELDRLKAPMYQYKAFILDTPEYYNVKRSKDEFRAVLERIESDTGCLVDMPKVECLPRPPTTITENQIDIDISTIMVANELGKNSFWVIKNKSIKVRVPIVLFVSMRNRQSRPIKIGLIYLDAKSVNGWADARMADSLLPSSHDMTEKPLVLEATNAAASMKGEYLVPSLYDRIIQPGDKVEGWIIAEYPKGFKFGNSIGDMRLSLLAGNQWIASKTFPSHPPVFGNNEPFEFYSTPLDTLITEDW